MAAFYLHTATFTDPFYLKKVCQESLGIFWFSSQIWFQGQQFCEDHCRHDVQCLLAMPASTGCYRAVRPTNSSCGEASRTRRWLQREISGKLCQIGQGFNCINHVDTMNYALRFEDVQLVPWRFFSADVFFFVFCVFWWGFLAVEKQQLESGQVFLEPRESHDFPVFWLRIGLRSTQSCRWPWR